MAEKKGLFRQYVSVLGSSTKGALGAETIKQAGQFAGAAYRSARAMQCPRCMEKSLRPSGTGYQCERTDICGYVAISKSEVDAMLQASSAIDPRILAVAKGFSGGFDERAAGAAKISLVFWIVTACIVSYGFSWAFEARWHYVLWVLLVGVYTSLNAIKYAYMAHRLGSGASLRPLAFLASPSNWFVR